MTHQPAATYRLQLHAGFPFAAAQEVLPYFARLGISDLYLSPIWTAVPGSVHGYDVTDHSQIHPELGGQEGFERLAARARELGLSLLLDFVPNHMGIGAALTPTGKTCSSTGHKALTPSSLTLIGGRASCCCPRWARCTGRFWKAGNGA